MSHDRIPRQGRSAREIAEQTGFTPRTIRSWTSEPRDSYLERAHERHEKIRQLRDQGLSMRAIGTELGISARAVHYALHKELSE